MRARLLGPSLTLRVEPQGMHTHVKRALDVVTWVITNVQCLRRLHASGLQRCAKWGCIGLAQADVISRDDNLEKAIQPQPTHVGIAVGDARQLVLPRQ